MKGTQAEPRVSVLGSSTAIKSNGAHGFRARGNQGGFQSEQAAAEALERCSSSFGASGGGTGASSMIRAPHSGSGSACP